MTRVADGTSAAERYDARKGRYRDLAPSAEPLGTVIATPWRVLAILSKRRRLWCAGVASLAGACTIASPTWAQTSPGTTAQSQTGDAARGPIVGSTRRIDSLRLRSRS